MNFLKVLTLSISLFIISNKSFSQCFEIESILVDACDNTTDEAYNEMFRMKIGGTALNTSTLSVNWPAQTWLGLVQNAATAAKVSQLNAAIVAAGGCGQILEPTGGVLPANSTVIVVTSPNLDTTLNPFGALTSTIYMIFQNTPTFANAGHFGNYNATPATRTLTVTFGAGCTDSVTYQRANLVNVFGAVGGSVADLNGSTVNFTPSGTASYVNNGCVAPVQPFTIEAGTTPITACAGQTINLSGTAQGQTSVSWSAASGSFSAANNLLTSYTVPTTATSGSSITLTLTATNSCAASISDTVIINVGGPSLTLTSGTASQNICLNTPMSPITYTFGGSATGATVTGLPSGVSFVVSGNTVTISGTPSTTTGSPFSYTVTTSGGSCGNASLNGTLSVNTAGSLNLFCDGPNSTPTSLAFDFSNVGQSSFTYSYTIDGGAPITGTHISPSNFTVSGLTAGQTVVFTLTANGVGCVPPETVTCSTSCPSPTLTLTSAAGTTTQSTCINSAITPITYTFGGSATGVTVTGLPTGVTATTSGNTVTITGTPSTTTGSPFSYSIITTGGSCGTTTLNGTITVNSNPTLVLSSAVATTSQSVCINTPINTITYTFGGSATGASVTGLPTGVTATTSGNTVTITGTPSTTTGSPFSYTIVTTGGSCGTLSLNGTITVNTNVSLILNSAANTTNQTICGSTNITPISYTFGNGATGATVTGLPAGVTTSTSGTTVTISGNPTGVIGTPYNYTITTIGGCGSQSLTGTITLTNGTIPTFTQVLPMCAGATSSPLPTTSNNGITGTWSPAFNNNTTTTYTFTPASGQCALNTQMTIQIYPAPTVTATNLNPTFCSGGTTNIQLSSTVPGAIFSWTVTGVNVLGAAGGNGNSINQLLTVSPGTTTTVEVIYTIVAEANGCVGTPTQIRVQINPIPDVMVSNNPGPICSGETTTISFIGSVPGTVFSWVITNITNLAGASNGTGTSIQQTLTTTGLSQGSVTYEITPTFNGCVGTPQSVTVLVNPRPELFTNPSHPPICSGENTSISVSTFNNNTTFTWTVNPIGVNGALSGTFTGLSTLIVQPLTTSGNTQGYVDYTIVPSSSGCSGTPITVRVYVNPLPKPVLTDGAICVDEFGVPFQSYTLDSGLDNATYDFVWYFNGVAIPNSNNATYTANAVGTYGVIATNSITNCVSSDITTMVTANVTSVTPAASMTVTQSAYFSGNATLTVNVTGGSGTLMYSLDEGTLQSSNVFTNVSSGPHTITVVDTQGCTYLTYTLLVIDYPHYFTPNGDGINDGWFIAGLQNTDVIHIFDRYGKLIKQLRGEEFWDGSYNQQQLPSTDYWFTVDYLENGAKKQFKAHFAMKR